MPLYPYLGEGEGSPTEIDYKKSALIPTSLLEDLGDGFGA